MKIIASLLYKFTERFLNKGIGLLVSIVLTRLLAPDLFGVVAIFSAIISIAQVLIDGGLSTALVQVKEVDEVEISSVFVLTLIISLVSYIILCILAPYILQFFEIENYIFEFRSFLIILLLYSINSVQTAILQRRMRFKEMMRIQLFSTFFSGTIGIAFAILGAGIWALIAYYVLNSVFTCVSFQFVIRLRPKLILSFSRSFPLIRYGYKIFLSALTCSLFGNIRTFIIGKIYSSSDLGIYSRAEQLPSIISSSVDISFQSVLLPVFSRIQDSLSDVRRMLRNTIFVDSLLNFPLMLGLASVAYPLVCFVYGDQWINCVPYIEVFCFSYIGTSISSPILTTIKAIGRSDIVFKLELFRRCVMLFILGISLSFGSLFSIACGWLISQILDVMIIMFAARVLSLYSFRFLVHDTFPVLLLSLVMSGCVYLLNRLDFLVIQLLICQVFVGVFIYVTGCVFFFSKRIRQTFIDLSK